MNTTIADENTILVISLGSLLFGVSIGFTCIIISLTMVIVLLCIYIKKLKLELQKKVIVVNKIEETELIDTYSDLWNRTSYTQHNLF